MGRYQLLPRAPPFDSVFSNHLFEEAACSVHLQGRKDRQTLCYCELSKVSSAGRPCFPWILDLRGGTFFRALSPEKNLFDNFGRHVFPMLCLQQVDLLVEHWRSRFFLCHVPGKSQPLSICSCSPRDVKLSFYKGSTLSSTLHLSAKN
jgi:hypothetical protein